MENTTFKNFLAKLGVSDFGKDIYSRIFNKKNWDSEYLVYSNIQDKISNKKYSYIKSEKKVLIGTGSPSTILQESIIAKAFEKIGVQPVAWVPRGKLIKKTYKLLGTNKFVHNDQFDNNLNIDEADSFLDLVINHNDLINKEWKNTRVGRFALSTMMRKERLGQITINQNQKKLLRPYIINSMIYTNIADQLLNFVKPSAVVLVDRGYTPGGEIFDLCMNKKIPVYTWNVGHKNQCFIYKKYEKTNRDSHPYSLSKKSWNILQNQEWSDQNEKKVIQEIKDCYNSKEWFAEVGTQVGTSSKTKDDIINEYNLDKNKKTACVFSHIYWDATFFWGVDLFKNYQEWFEETLKLACKNTNLNWLLKVHPANLTKNLRDGVEGAPSEIQSIKKIAPKGLPNHIKVINADDNISTLSLFEFIDYCLTVRGTVGIEAAVFGKRTLTAGTGRYDRLGFTTDFDSKGEYLKQLETLETAKLINEEQRMLALKYAYGILIQRPMKTIAINTKNEKNEHADLKVSINTESLADYLSSPEVIKLARWLKSKDEDYLS